MNLKELVRDYWNRQPCGSKIDGVECETLDYFDEIARRRYAQEPFIIKHVESLNLNGKKVLEIGCGVGTDSGMFASHGADLTAVDISEHSVELANKNLELHKWKADIRVADAENLPFKDNYFDFVYSWGVLHHAPDTLKAISEVRRVLKPDGEACIMLYNRCSLVSLQMYILFGLLRFRPWAKLDDLYSKYHESPGTKVYTHKAISEMFKDWRDVKIFNQLTCYDLRCGAGKKFPFAIAEFLIPEGFGFFNIIKAKK